MKELTTTGIICITCLNIFYFLSGCGSKCYFDIYKIYPLDILVNTYMLRFDSFRIILRNDARGLWENTGRKVGYN